MKNALPPAVLVLALTILSTAPQQGLGPAINSATYRPRFAIYGSACAELVEVQGCDAPSLLVEQKHCSAMIISMP